MSKAVAWLSLACLAKVRMNSWLARRPRVDGLAANAVEAFT
jgi:hypothetical protein